MGGEQTVLVFASTHQVLRADELLTAAGVPHEVIPKPRTVSADCGVAIALSPDRGAPALAALEAGGLPPEAVYVHFPAQPAPEGNGDERS